MSRGKIRAGIVALTVGAILGVSGFAIAAFVQNKEATASGAAEAFETVTVEGTQTGGAMLPGEAANVSLLLDNPNTNVRAQVIDINVGVVTVDPVSLNDPTQAATCAAFVSLNADDPSNVPLPILGKDAAATYILNNAVVFGDAPQACEGMIWTTSWTVSFQAVR